MPPLNYCIRPSKFFLFISALCVLNFFFKCYNSFGNRGNLDNLAQDAFCFNNNNENALLDCLKSIGKSFHN